MSTETEKKFLVTSDVYKTLASKQTHIIQGYLSSVPERTVRIRIRNKTGFITVKGIGNESGVTRYEWEKEIPLPEAQELLKLCEPGIIDKTRYEIVSGKHTLEIDEFHGENKGLVIAEVELTDESEQINKPAWFGVEVTGDVRYYNSMLMKKPFSAW